MLPPIVLGPAAGESYSITSCPASHPAQQARTHRRPWKAPQAAGGHRQRAVPSPESNQHRHGRAVRASTVEGRPRGEQQQSGQPVRHGADVGQLQQQVRAQPRQPGIRRRAACEPVPARCAAIRAITWRRKAASIAGALICSRSARSRRRDAGARNPCSWFMRLSPSAGPAPRGACGPAAAVTSPC